MPPRVLAWAKPCGGKNICIVFLTSCIRESQVLPRGSHGPAGGGGGRRVCGPKEYSFFINRFWYRFCPVRSQIGYGFWILVLNWVYIYFFLENAI